MNGSVTRVGTERYGKVGLVRVEVSDTITERPLGQSETPHNSGR